MNKSRREKTKAIHEFLDRWADHGDEKQEAQSFWVDLLQSVLDIPNATKVIRFEREIKLEKKHHGFIDGYIPSTKVLIEQKGFDTDLNKPQRQSDGEFLTPYEQAKRYADQMAYDDRPRWIVVSNFHQLFIYDMNKPHEKPEEIRLQDLHLDAHRLAFLVDREKVLKQRELEVSLQAGDLVGKLYDALEKQFEQPMSDHDYLSLNKLCVRLVFCLYAEDAGLFGDDQFHSYLKEQSKLGIPRLNFALKTLFKTLNTKESERDPDDDPALLAFPYVNGGLFADDTSRIPRFNEEVFDLLVNKASAGFDWSEISPTIFGAVFESTLNKETRRQGGMHYTSIENIHKVIDPLFLDGIKAEFAALKKRVKNSSRITTGQRKELQAFQEKIGSLTFLDPACGSGNFLTETYLSLRKIENEALDLLYGGQQSFKEVSPIQVKIDHFYGIEINDFAVVVAKTALWIAESQMMRATEDIVQQDLNFLPLKSAAHIVEGNALTIDWNDVINSDGLNYIIGNPPFYGASKMTAKQKKEVVAVIGAKKKLVNSIDYVGGWYYKLADYVQGTDIRSALVSTNSITQGEQVAPLWGELLNEKGMCIDFAHRTFVWDSESLDKAHVYCVIIGLSLKNDRDKYIYTNGEKTKASNINPYLVDAPNIFVVSRSTPLSQTTPQLTKGNQATDKGNFILTQEERDMLVESDKRIESCVKRFIGAKDFINDNEVRYCLWLKGVSASLYSKNKFITDRLEKIRQFRSESTAKPTRDSAQWSYQFFSSPQEMDKKYLVIPRVSSEKRLYIPIDFLPDNAIASDSVSIVHLGNKDGIYEFGVLTSSVHMAWMRAVAGRLEMRYRYSGAVVYNNFIWPCPSAAQRKKIEATARTIREVRAKHPELTFAEMYDVLEMPRDLLAAHKANDRAVMAAYGFKSSMTEPEIVAELFKLYQARTDEIAAEEARQKEAEEAAKPRRKRGTKTPKE